MRLSRKKKKQIKKELKTVYGILPYRIFNHFGWKKGLSILKGATPGMTESLYFNNLFLKKWNIKLPSLKWT